MLIVALRVAGLDAGTLAVGGAFTAVVLGLAAQQTLGNLFAGLVLLSTRPFRVGERVQLRGGALAGEVEGIAGSLGLFYTTLVSGADRIMVPNSVILQLAVVPRREPERVELRARFDASTSPSDLQERLDDAITVPIRYPPDVALEELDRDEVVLKIAATPVNAERRRPARLRAARRDAHRPRRRPRRGLGPDRSAVRRIATSGGVVVACPRAEVPQRPANAFDGQIRRHAPGEALAQPLGAESLAALRAVPRSPRRCRGRAGRPARASCPPRGQAGSSTTPSSGPAVPTGSARPPWWIRIG